MLAGFGSGVAAETVAVFEIVVAAPGAVTAMAMGAAAVPVPRAARVHVTETLPVLVQVHPVPPAETKVTPAGKVSVTAAATASEGPLFVTVMV